MTQKLSASQRRGEAFDAVCNQMFAPDGRMVPGLTVEKAVDLIESLFGFGRSERWHRELTRWSNMVAATVKAEDREQYFRWALLQGAVYVNYVVR